MQRKEQAVMTEEPQAEVETTTEEVSVKAKDLVQTVEDLIQEASVRRVMLVRGDRTLFDLPLPLGVAGAAAVAIYMAPLGAIASIAALVGGCTLRIEREEPAGEE
jgi:hypothetical protein